MESTKAGLVRGLRKWDLIAVAVNGIIGAGIFGLPAAVYGKVGSYSLIAFVVCAVVVTLVILCFAEVGSRFTETGGPYLYAREAFGSLIGFEVGWMMWLAIEPARAHNPLYAYAIQAILLTYIPGTSHRLSADSACVRLVRIWLTQCSSRLICIVYAHDGPEEEGDEEPKGPGKNGTGGK